MDEDMILISGIFIILLVLSVLTVFYINNKKRCNTSSSVGEGYSLPDPTSFDDCHKCYRSCNKLPPWTGLRGKCRDNCRTTFHNKNCYE